MSPVLSTKQKLFINRMTENQEQAKWGFEILLKRQDFADFFDHLRDANLFSPEYNSGPVPAEDPGHVRIPYWSALDYLEAVAKQAGDNNEIQLAQKVMDVIRSVSSYRDPDGRSRDNYHTYRKFAEILGLVPTAAITTEDLRLIPVWLSSKYDRGVVGHALDLGALRRWLASDTPGDWKKAITILDYCTAILWAEEKGLGKGRKKPVSVVKDYWLKELIRHHASTFGVRAGREAAQIFCDRIRKVFGEEFGDLPTYLSWPAVEDHPQNHSWDKVVNAMVEGLRDVLLSWVEEEPEGAAPFIEEILRDENEMVRRIAIYVLGQRWSVLKNLYNRIVSSQLFDSRNIHELYQLLKERFSEFSEPDKTATLEAIRQLSPLPNHEDRDRFLRRTQRNWLSAIAGKGYEPADSWFKELEADQSIGKLSKHPDFHSYMETWWGPGPSPYTIQELLAFAEEGSLIKRLNDFQQSSDWSGPSTPSTKALVDTLEEIVGINPRIFLDLLPAFLEAKRPYQYGIINGFKRLWDMPKDTRQDLDWNVAWERLIHFFEQLLDDTDFWAEEVVDDHDLTPTRNWIPPVIAEFLRAGTRDDNNAYSPDLLSSAFSLVKILLEKLKAVDDAKEDAMFQAINSPKGKAIEALFSHTLRVCRISDKERGYHTGVWEVIKPVFDSELAKCENANYEFSTLAAAYLANIDYINPQWLKASIDRMFPKDFRTNFVCAIEGLAYASASHLIYKLLLEHGVLDRALRLEPTRRQAREKLIERVALAYLWRDESLDSPRLSYLFEPGQNEDLQDAIGFFSSARRQKLTKEQIDRILLFWEKCVTWAEALTEPPKSLLSRLSLLICYVTTLSDKEIKLLLAVAPYVNVEYNADTFIEELDRLVEQDPARISLVLGKVLDGYEPDFDYEDRLEKLLIKLAKNGRIDDALRYTDRIKLPGMVKLFKQLTERGNIT
ncbi:MAG: hypothetical protein PHT49_07000 [Desulfovibrionales bacterium]|nr:hypothetical protein [Desulfovibrionales bacterium]